MFNQVPVYVFLFLHGNFPCDHGTAYRDLIVALQYLEGASVKDGDRIFSRTCCDRIRANGLKLKDD